MKLFVSYFLDDAAIVRAQKLRDEGPHAVWIDGKRLVGAGMWSDPFMDLFET